jgi:phosphoribosylformimino-5-aminoimidazole carboxamide ribotide isomerase
MLRFQPGWSCSDRQDTVLILPAIDIRGGQCVRLRQGDYSQETVFGSDPADMARRWVDQSASYLHLVDLDGAKQGKPVNGESVRAILSTIDIPCQLGGGLRTDADIAEVLHWGVERVVVGTKALNDPAWFEAVTRRFPGRIVLGIDTRNGMVATEGWLETSQRSAINLARQCASLPLAAIVYTDIGRDGMLEGPNIDGLRQLVESVDLPIIASGGVTTLEDIKRLSQLRLAGCIIGRALYEGRLDLTKAIAAANSFV